MQNNLFLRGLNCLLALMLAAALCQTVQIWSLERRARQLAGEIRQAEAERADLPDFPIPAGFAQ